MGIHWKRGIALGAALWMLGLVTAAALVQILILQEHGWVLDTLYFLMFTLFIWAASKLYFGSEIASLYEGAKVGLLFIATSLVLDLLITVPIFLKSYTAYFSGWQLWVYFLELVVVTALTGATGSKTVLRINIEKFK